MARGPQREVHDLIDMTAMVDIVFFLLIFFLVTSFVSLSAAIQAPAGEPVVGHTARAQSDDPAISQPLVVRIDEDGIIWVEQEAAHGMPDLIQRLRAAREETEADGIKIVASGEATHGKLVMALDAGVAAGFKEAQLTVSEVE